MDAKHSGETLKRLEKQNDLLMEAYRSMSHELHKLQVEEEMLMRKFYNIMDSQKLMKKVCKTMTKGRQMIREMETRHQPREMTVKRVVRRVLQFPRSFGASSMMKKVPVLKTPESLLKKAVK